MKILLISDIHGNFPALKAILRQVQGETFDHILNCGDTTVYATFPNETLDWLRKNGAVSILGNTDSKILKLLSGKTVKKPRKAEKRIMYTWTADNLTSANKQYLAKLNNNGILELAGYRIGLFHGSPENDNEFLFHDTPAARFQVFARKTDCDIIITGHSHSPYHKKINHVHFINPGSVGRMFDGCPDASYAVLELSKDTVRVKHFRCPYDVNETAEGLKKNLLPGIYEEMYLKGRKLN